MPELPEVEVVKRSLKKKILNLTIKKIEIKDGKLRYSVNRQEIIKLIGKKILDIKRRSKFLIFDLEKNISMVAHLGMTGKFFYIDENKKKYKTSFYYNLGEKKEKNYDKIIFFFKRNKKLIYNDVRRFGFLKFFKQNKDFDYPHLRNLGPEPLGKNWNYKYLRAFTYRGKRNIKNLLMDQKCVSGLGNIYVNEILFLSGVTPLRKVSKLKKEELYKIIENTKKILKKAISQGGSSIKDFSSEDGKKGSYQQHFKVYGRNGKKCSNVDCNKNIIRIVISNRASFFCKNCQK